MEKERVKHLIFHPNTTVFLIVYPAVSLILFVRGFDWRVALFAFVCSYLPDVDYILYHVLKHKFGMKLSSHWAIAHYPLAFIPAMCAAGWYFGEWLEVSQLYMLTLGGTLTFAHFVTDSVYWIGFPWFLPFWNGRISISDGRLHLADLAMVREHYKRVEQWGEMDDIHGRIPNAHPFQIWMFLMGAIIFFLFLF